MGCGHHGNGNSSRRILACWAKGEPVNTLYYYLYKFCASGVRIGAKFGLAGKLFNKPFSTNFC